MFKIKSGQSSDEGTVQHGRGFSSFLRKVVPLMPSAKPCVYQSQSYSRLDLDQILHMLCFWENKQSEYHLTDTELRTKGFAHKNTNESNSTRIILKKLNKLKLLFCSYTKALSVFRRTPDTDVHDFITVH